MALAGAARLKINDDFHQAKPASTGPKTIINQILSLQTKL